MLEYGIVVDNDECALYEGVRVLLADSNLMKKYAEKANERGKYFCTENTVDAVEAMLLKSTYLGGNDS